MEVIMAVRNLDGSPYQPSGQFQQYDPQNQEMDLFNDLDREVIEIGGSPILYFEVMIQSNTVDPLFLEDRGKLWATDPVCLYAFYDPVPAQNYMNTFGLDAPDEIMFELNYKSVLEKLGHPPTVGSRIYTPHRKEHWEIIQRSDEVYQMWGQFRLQIMCKRFQETLTTGEGKVTQAANYPIDSSHGLR